MSQPPIASFSLHQVLFYTLNPHLLPRSSTGRKEQRQCAFTTSHKSLKSLTFCCCLVAGRGVAVEAPQGVWEEPAVAASLSCNCKGSASLLAARRCKRSCLRFACCWLLCDSASNQSSAGAASSIDPWPCDLIFLHAEHHTTVLALISDINSCCTLPCCINSSSADALRQGLAVGGRSVQHLARTTFMFGTAPSHICRQIHRCTACVLYSAHKCFNTGCKPSLACVLPHPPHLNFQQRGQCRHRVATSPC